jgi:hypothetical protein
MNYIIIYTLYTYRNVSFAAYVRTISLFDNHCQSNEVYVQGWIMIKVSRIIFGIKCYLTNWVDVWYYCGKLLYCVVYITMRL